MLPCTRCKTTKSVDDFAPSMAAKPGGRWCRACCSAAYHEKGDTNRAKKRAYYHATTRARRKTPEYKERSRPTWRRYAQNRRLAAYGLTANQYDALLITQAGRCAICGDELLKPHLDHCHVTGVPRGILCDTCNPGLGLFRDDAVRLAAAIDYLESHAAVARNDTA